MQTFATGYRNYQTLTHFDIEPDADLVIKNEVIEERSANSKTYLLEDGTYCSLTTSEPIHTYSNGEWVDIESNSTEPETIDDAISQLSSVRVASLEVGSDDGFINTAIGLIFMQNKKINFNAIKALLFLEALMMFSIDILMRNRQSLLCLIVMPFISAIILITYLIVEIKKRYSQLNILFKLISIISFLLTNVFWLLSKFYIESTEVNFIVLAITIILFLPAGMIASFYQNFQKNNQN